jgi:dihydroflavonol-4-reductase
VVAVTGATGHLGAALVRELLAAGEKVRAIVREGSDLRGVEGLSVELWRAELGGASGGKEDGAGGLEHAFASCDIVYHAAARISFGPEGGKALHATNVEGTRAALRAARVAGVPRFVYVSSIEAFPLASAAGAVAEVMGLDESGGGLEYGMTKALATRAVLDAAAEGYDAVVAYPTAIVGPYDFRLSPMGRLVRDFARRALPAYVDGGFDFVDVRDVAAGLLLVARRGKRGEGYLLSGHYIEIADLMELLEEITGVRKPRLDIPAGLLRPFVPLVEFYYGATGRPPRFTRASLDILSRRTHVDSGKARRELGYESRPLEESFRDAVAWFKEHGLLS